VRVFEQQVSLPSAPEHRGLLAHLRKAVEFRLEEGLTPSRFLVTRMTNDHYECELGVVEDPRAAWPLQNIFDYAPRRHENTSQFTAVLLVPTGIGAEIGGHAGDAGPLARAMAAACDLLVTHPNVVNASDINELPDNALYVEGSVLTRLVMGTIGLQPVRGNRVVVVLDAHKSDALRNASINAVNGARAAYGLNCPKIILLDPPLSMRAEYKASGGASGEVSGLGFLLEILKRDREDYDAVALSSVIKVPHSYHQEYFDREGDMVNPWGGVEALLTHAVSAILNVPSAHSPMFESEDIANMDPGIVEPRMAAEAVSLTFLQCILKGLQRSPRIISDSGSMGAAGVVSAADISCLVIPDGCVGLPTLAALEQGMPVIAVRENANLMRNNLRALPWRPGQLHIAENYWEAIGIMTSLRAGIPPAAMRRPVPYVDVDVCEASASEHPMKVDRG
jgi:hypothetical protein